MACNTNIFRCKTVIFLDTDCLWFIDDKKVLDCWCDLSNKGQSQKMPYYGVFIVSADICN